MDNSESFVSLLYCVTTVDIADALVVSDATVLLRDIAGDAAQKTATKINPSEDALAQIDAPAEDNTWHDVPNLSPAELKAQAQNKYNSKKPFNRNDVKAAAGDASGAATGTRDPAEAGTVASDQGGAGVDARGGANAAMNRLRDTTSANVPDDQKDAARDTAREYQNRTKGYLQEKVPKERRDQTIYRLKKMIVEIQSHSDCKSVMRGCILTTTDSPQTSPPLKLCSPWLKSMEDTRRI